MSRIRLFVLSVAVIWGGLSRPMAALAGPSVVSSPKASFLETLAAREIRRYVYVRTGELLPLEQGDAVDAGDFQGVVVGQKDRPVVRSLATDATLAAAVAGLNEQGYLIRTIQRDNLRCVLVAGGDELGTLYGAYRLAEHLGVRFYLHGDVVPDDRMAFEWPIIDDIAEPLFGLRGIQPFHDFPEGPDWWNLNDYKAVLSQLPKLRMNFFGLHTYPEGRVGPEPTVWIGSPADLQDDGTIRFSYPSRHFTTQNGTWGYKEEDSGGYPFGASLLFERDSFGAVYMSGMTPWPATPETCNELFERMGAVLNEAFTHARSLGIKTCVGTEIPLIIPTPVKERLKAGGKDPADPAVIREMYEGIFARIAKTYPLDYYWFWTDEGWTWSGVTDEKLDKTMQDFRMAIEAREKVNPPFGLATCGWVLGPQSDRALFDNELPKDMPMSCINRQVGKSPVEPGFARISGRGQWAIPWLEDDPNMISPQLWVGRMRRDAFDARRYGCSGLMGIHWRTRVLGPNVSALAKAAWDQSGWSEAAAAQAGMTCDEGAVGGNVAAYPNAAIEATDEDTVYQTVRYDMSAYRIKVPDGTYTVTLKFCEPHHKAANQRVFGVEIQGRRVLHKLDIFAKVGQNKAFDHVAKDVRVESEPLTIDFTQRVEFPCVAAIVVEGKGFVRKINCGGPKYEDYEADLPQCPELARHLPASDFYADWAVSQFGPQVAPQAADLFARLDGHLPEPATWVEGPGGIQPDARGWEQAARDYAFVEEFAALRSKVSGAGYLERFDYWLSSFRYMKAIARLKCIWGAYNEAMAKVEAAKEADARSELARKSALPLRREMILALGDVYRHLFATVKTTGEMGTVTNWAQHIEPMLLTEPGKKLADAMGEPLPPGALPPTTYTGPAYLIVPTVRTSLSAGESLKFKAIVLAEEFPDRVVFACRELGTDTFTKLPMMNVGRGVYVVAVASNVIGVNDFEYYVEAVTADGETLRFPATAPGLNQTVVVVP